MVAMTYCTQQFQALVRRFLPAIFLMVGIVCFHGLNEISAEEIGVTMYPQSSCPTNTPVTVSFGMPFPKGMMTNANYIRVKNSFGDEIPANVRVLLPWRDLSTGQDLSSIRSALVQVKMTFQSVNTPMKITVETGYQRTQNINEESVRNNWVVVNDTTYPQGYGVYEPIVYATLPPKWMGDCGIKSYTVPFGSYTDFNWYDNLLTNNDPYTNSGQNFFKTMINDEVSVSTTNQIHYLNHGEYEPWLYDRAMTMWQIYIRSGAVKVLKEAHRASYFYALHIKSNGFFDLDNIDDLKYSYGEGILTDLMLMGDEGNKSKLETVTLAADTFTPIYDPNKTHGLWTERHFAFAWLAYITAFEATGKSTYKLKAVSYMDELIKHQNTVQYNVTYGSAPLDGALMHDYIQHEGWWDNTVPYWVYSPWMSTLLVDVMERYFLHSNDRRVIDSVKKFGDALIKCGSRKVNTLTPDFYEPWYLSSSTQPIEVQNLGCTISSKAEDDWTDFEHNVDVSKILAFAYYLSGDIKYKTEFDKLINGAQEDLKYWIRPAAHSSQLSIYRLTPARKANWWFRTTNDLDYLINRLTPTSYNGEVSGGGQPQSIVNSSLAQGQMRIIGSTAQRGIINPDKGDSVKIYFKGNGTGKYECRVFTLIGEKVWEQTMDSVSEGMFEWFPKNVASGAYIAHIKGPGINASKKFAVLR